MDRAGRGLIGTDGAGVIAINLLLTTSAQLPLMRWHRSLMAGIRQRGRSGSPGGLLPISGKEKARRMIQAGS